MKRAGRIRSGIVDLNVARKGIGNSAAVLRAANDALIIIEAKTACATRATEAGWKVVATL